LKGKFVKKVKHKVPWISHIIDRDNVREFNQPSTYLTRVDQSRICILCRGAKNLCGRKVCPVILKSKRLLKVSTSIDKRLDGASPPEIFVGRIGYPKVYVGPLLHKEKGDISTLGTPELWDLGSINEFLDMRLSLVRGMKKLDARKPAIEEKFYDKIVETTLSRESVDTYVEFNRIHRRIIVDPYVQPIGIGGTIDTLDIAPRGSLQALEKVFYDEDLRADEAIRYLYRNNVLVSKIIQGFSAGMFGVGFQRRLVPTRWSITAIDCILSKWLRDEVIREKPQIGEYMVFEYEGLGDKFIVLLFPDTWKYEFLEVWWPGSAWNFFGNFIAIGGDHELHWGRTTYASIGGCYYATRLAVTEYLSRIGRQAGVLVIREAYPEHFMPIGVWYVRESVRKTLKGKPQKFPTWEAALNYALSRLKIAPREIIKSSYIINYRRKQKTILEYMSHAGLGKT